MTETLERIEARAAILDGLYAYCRGIDRWDREVLVEVFHPQATLEYPSFSGDRDALVESMWHGHSHVDMHSHQVTNVLVKIDDSLTTATSESYVTAALWRADEGAPETDQYVVGGRKVGGRSGTLRLVQARYLDRWAVEDSRWQIRQRLCVVDISTTSRRVGAIGRGRRDPEDPSYEFI